MEFQGAAAELVDAQGRPFAKHYAGPTWEAPDGSRIVGKVLATSLLRTQAQYHGCYCRQNLQDLEYLPACVLPTGQHLWRGRADWPLPDGGDQWRVDYTADYLFYK